MNKIFSKEEKEILEEFIYETPRWLKSMYNVETATGQKMCPVCGARFESISKLMKVVKKIYYEKTNIK